jgi:2-amino-4-hydroxy-6-hydroxymethyldihydropteridine diphosphokinase
VEAFLALGSNLGDRWANLALGVGGLEAIGTGLCCSPIYETAPVGGPDGQGPFLNCVVRLDVERSAEELLAACMAIEQRAGRVRIEHWGPRTLDVDVLFYGDETIDTPDLTVPHPRLYERAFVLVPLADLAPSRADPWLAGVDVTEVRRVGELVRSALPPTTGTGDGPERIEAR